MAAAGDEAELLDYDEQVEADAEALKVSVYFLAFLTACYVYSVLRM